MGTHAVAMYQHGSTVIQPQTVRTGSLQDISIKNAQELSEIIWQNTIAASASING